MTVKKDQQAKWKEDNKPYIVVYHRNQEFENKINEYAAKGYRVIGTGGGAEDSYVIMNLMSTAKLKEIAPAKLRKCSG